MKFEARRRTERPRTKGCESRLGIAACGRSSRVSPDLYVAPTGPRRWLRDGAPAAPPGEPPATPREGAGRAPSRWRGRGEPGSLLRAVTERQNASNGNFAGKPPGSPPPPPGPGWAGKGRGGAPASSPGGGSSAHCGRYRGRAMRERALSGGGPAAARERQPGGGREEGRRAGGRAGGRRRPPRSAPSGRRTLRPPLPPCRGRDTPLTAGGAGREGARPPVRAGAPRGAAPHTFPAAAAARRPRPPPARAAPAPGPAPYGSPKGAGTGPGDPRSPPRPPPRSPPLTSERALATAESPSGSGGGGPRAGGGGGLSPAR